MIRTLPPTKHVVNASLGEPSWLAPRLEGENYQILLQRFHELFKPQTYLEIGVAEGATLELAECFSIGVDTNFAISQSVLKNKSACCFFQMTSDKFFKDFDPTAIFGRPVDMAFLDGMHLFEFLLRDFINVERHCKPNSVIFIHDCVPTDQYVGRRDVDDHTLREHSAHPEWWTGDVWKTLAIIFKHRPDLRVNIFNAYPTGLAAVTHLDSTSTLLADCYRDLVASYERHTLSEHGVALFQHLNLSDTRQFTTFKSLSRLLWV